MAKRVIPYIQITPRFYLYEFDEVLAALKKLYQVDARSLRETTQMSPRSPCADRGFFLSPLSRSSNGWTLTASRGNNRPKQ